MGLLGLTVIHVAVGHRGGDYDGMVEVLDHSGNGLDKRRLAHGALARPVAGVLRYPVNIRGHGVLSSASARVERVHVSERWLVRRVVGRPMGH